MKITSAATLRTTRAGSLAEAGIAEMSTKFRAGRGVVDVEV
jgi:hypothetical protein